MADGEGSGENADGLAAVHDGVCEEQRVGSGKSGGDLGASADETAGDIRSGIERCSG